MNSTMLADEGTYISGSIFLRFQELEIEIPSYTIILWFYYVQDKGNCSVSLDAARDGHDMRMAQNLERRKKKMESYLRRQFPWPWLWLSLCSLTVGHPSHPQLTAFCKLVCSSHCHTDGDGFWMWRHHQVWLSLDKVTKNCFWGSKSGPASFWVLLHLVWSSVEGSSCQMGWSSRWDSCPQGSLLLVTQSHFVPETMRLRPRKQIHFSWNFHQEQCFSISALLTFWAR